MNKLFEYLRDLFGSAWSGSWIEDLYVHKSMHIPRQTKHTRCVLEHNGASLTAYLYSIEFVTPICAFIEVVGSTSCDGLELKKFTTAAQYQGDVREPVTITLFDANDAVVFTQSKAVVDTSYFLDKQQRDAMQRPEHDQYTRVCMHFPLNDVSDDSIRFVCLLRLPWTTEDTQK